MTEHRWRWVEPGEVLAADTPTRQLSIRWDENDEGWFLSVVKPARPASMGQPAVGAEHYVTPMPLLVALVLVPAEFHEALIARVRMAHAVVRGFVFGALGSATDALPRPWPGAAVARDRLAEASGRMVTLERLALDMAASEALED